MNTLLPRLIVAGMLLAALPAIQAQQVASCPAAAVPFKGENQHTPVVPLQRFMMVSAYHLEPYTDAYLDDVLGDLGRHGMSGVVYSSFGDIADNLRRHGAVGESADEQILNRRIFDKARRAGAGIWLQVQVYNNRLRVDGAEPRNVEAREILASRAARKAYVEQLRSNFQVYNEYFADACTVVMFEEAGIYHAAQGGGTFWSSEPDRPAGEKPDQAHDEMFAERMSGLFAEASHQIKSINPHCRVGMHLGHSTFNNPEVLQKAIAGLQQQKAGPDFMFYDFYLKAQPDFGKYADKLAQRKTFISQTLGLPAYHLAQLHTMNNFQHGLGGTPSQVELDRMMQLDRSLGFDGVGYYSKNAMPTSVFDNQPMAPNTVGQATVYESSKDRWDYGVLKLLEAGGVDFSGLFDLVIQHGGAGDIRISARNRGSGKWDLLGVQTATQPLLALRELSASVYLDQGRRADLRIEGGGGTVKLWLLPSRPSTAFHSAVLLAAEIAATGAPAGSRGQLQLTLDDGQRDSSLCLQ